MQANRFAEFTAESQERILVYWRSLQEIAEAIHRWADNTGRIGSVETVLDLTDDSGKAVSHCNTVLGTVGFSKNS